jgi:sialate O-acetylesterase
MKRSIVATIILILSFNISYSLELSELFKDNMVLQQNDTLRIWGWGRGWSKITVTTSWGEADTVWVNAEKNWSAKLNTPQGNFNNHTITIREYGVNKDNTINHEDELGKVEIKNVLIGEVWLCSGQSNMDWDANAGIKTGETEVPAANYPHIRFFKIGKRISDYPQDDLAGGSWLECTPETMPSFSAVGYFFGKAIHMDLNVPVGLISDAWGGIPIDVAYPAASVIDIPDLYESSKGDYWYGAPLRLGTLYNGMTHPLRNFSIAGMIWYQGEGNTGVTPELYARKQEVLVEERRKQFGENMPFYYVQIAPFNYGNIKQAGAIIRDQQRLAANIRHSEMVVVSDVGDTSDIHPQHKKPVGDRLANMALKYHYQVMDELVEFPLFKRAYQEKKYVFVEFAFAEGLHFKEGDKGYFELAGDDGSFISVRAKIINDKVRLDAGKIKNPEYVRFAFSDIATPLLLNKAKLPASCFSRQVID